MHPQPPATHRTPPRPHCASSSLLSFHMQAWTPPSLHLRPNPLLVPQNRHGQAATTPRRYPHFPPSNPPRPATIFIPEPYKKHSQHLPLHFSLFSPSSLRPLPFSPRRACSPANRRARPRRLEPPPPRPPHSATSRCRTTDALFHSIAQRRFHRQPKPPLPYVASGAVAATYHHHATLCARLRSSSTGLCSPTHLAFPQGSQAPPLAAFTRSQARGSLASPPF